MDLKELRYKRPFLIGVLGLISTLIYSSTLVNGFVYDDTFQILGNRWIRDVRYIPEIFSSPVWGFNPGAESNYYRPLMHIFFMAEYHLFGTSPWGYHLTNILLHGANTVLLFLFAEAVIRAYVVIPLSKGEVRPSGAGSIGVDNLLLLPFFSALFFALHPVHTEVVAWVSALPDLLVTTFALLAAYAYILSRGASGTIERCGYVGLSVLAFGAALLLKESGLMVLLMIGAYDICNYRGGATSPVSALLKASKRYLPYILLLPLYLYVRGAALGSFIVAKQHTGLGITEYLLNIPALLGKYIRMMLLPVELNLMHHYTPVSSLLDPTLLVSFLLIVLMVLPILLLKGRLLTLSALLFLIPLLPVLYLPGVGVRGNIFAERYLYLPSVGFSIFIVTLFIVLYRRTAGKRLGRLGGEEGGEGVEAAVAFKIPLTIVVLILFSLFTYMTLERIPVWKNDYTLWKDTSEKSEGSYVIYVNLGTAADELGLTGEALRAYGKALEIRPDSAEVHNNLGVIYSGKRRFAEALDSFERALKSSRKGNQLKAIHSNVGDIYMAQKRYGEAAREYRLATEAGTDSAESFNRLGIALALISGNGSGKDGTTGVESMREAEGAFRRALELNPGHKGARANLERLLGQNGPKGQRALKGGGR